MEYKITEEYRKLLTEEVLGEKWHGDSPMPVALRTFTTDQDRTDVFRAIRDKGIWKEFDRYTYEKAVDENIFANSSYTRWLFLDNPERACCLAAEFWKENGK